MDLLNLENDVIDERLIRAVKEMGFEQFSPIQEQAIPEILEGKDVIGQAQTGTGKTAAFGLPILQTVSPDEQNLQALILCPTRELAIQAADEIRKFAKYMHGIKVLPIYGGQDMGRQIKALKGCPQIIVGTPGRVMDHMRRRTIRLNDIKMVVLDEADEMLNMGFREDMETILSQIDHEHQTVLFSATMPKSILDITGEFQKDPVLIKTVKKELTVPLIKQYYYEVRKENKKEVVARLLDYYNPKLTLIFCNTKRMVEELSEDLKGRGYCADGIHGDLSQNQRDRVMESFRNGSTDILIATDVAARGIDVDDVEAVINYDVPQDNEYYVHRIGRTGRAGRKGRAFTLVVGREIYKIREIESICKTSMKAKVVPTVADITEAKSKKILDGVVEVMRAQDLASTMAIIEAKMEEEDCTAMELAAAFLRSQLGEEKEEIPVVSYEEERRKRKGFGKKNSDKKDFDKKKDGKREFASRAERKAFFLDMQTGHRKKDDKKSDKKDAKKDEKRVDKKSNKRVEKTAEKWEESASVSRERFFGKKRYDTREVEQAFKKNKKVDKKFDKKLGKKKSENK